MIHYYILFIEDDHFILPILIEIFQFYLHGSNICVYATNLLCFMWIIKAKINKFYFGEDGKHYVWFQWNGLEKILFIGKICMLLIITTRIWPCGQWCILHLGLWLTFWKDGLEVQLILENLTYIKGPTRAFHALKMIKDSCNWDYILVWLIIIWKDAIFDLVVKNVSLYNPISKGDILRLLWGTFFVSNPLKWGMKGLDGFHMDWF